MVQSELVIEHSNCGGWCQYETDAGNEFKAEYEHMGWREYPTYIHVYNCDGTWKTTDTDEHQRLWFDSEEAAQAHIHATFQRVTRSVPE